MRTKKTVIILISGKGGSGKTTVKDLLLNKLQEIPSITVLPYAFAGPIKYIAKAFMGWDGQKDDKGRILLQMIGKIGRDYNPDIWVKHLINQMDKKAGLLPFNFVIVDDWRFPNELAYLQKNPLLDIITIRVWGRGGLNEETVLDVTENSLPEAYYGDSNPMPSLYDFIIDNNAELEQLENKLDTILAEIEKQYIVE